MWPSWHIDLPHHEIEAVNAIGAGLKRQMCIHSME